MEKIEFSKEFSPEQIKVINKFIGPNKKMNSLIYLSAGNFIGSYYFFKNLDFSIFSSKKNFDRKLITILSKIEKYNQTKELPYKLIIFLKKIENFDEIRILNSLGFIKSKEICLIIFLLLYYYNKVSFDDLKIEDKNIFGFSDYQMQTMIDLFNNNVNNKISKIIDGRF